MLSAILKRREPIKPLSAKRPALRRLRGDLARVLYAFLQLEAPKIAKQINTRRRQVGKGATPTPDEQAAIDAVLADLDFAGWAVLVSDVQPLLEEITADGSIAALHQIQFDAEASPEVLNVVSQDAVAYAEERAAEMVGMRVDELGRLVPNPNATWRIDEGTRAYLRAAVSDAVSQGWSNDRLAEEIQGSYGFSAERSLTIARTETNLASNRGALNSYQASGVVDGKQWVTAEDDLVSEECRENGEAGPNGDGVLFDLEATFPSGDIAPPVHPNCLPGDALVSACGRITATSKRRYDGDVLVVRTASGKQLTCTPNHPVLTDRGFVAARLLHKGGKVISRREWMSTGHHDGDNVPSRIEDVTKARWRARKVPARKVPLAAEDFHGDGVGSEIAVIRSDRFLADHGDTALRKGMRSLKFHAADMKASALYGLCALQLLRERVHASTHSFVRHLHLASARVLAHVAPLQSLRFALAASVGAGFAQAQRDSVARDTEGQRDFVFGAAGRVFADEVIDIEVEPFHGDVFNLSTVSGYYVANGIVTHNCRCAIVPFIDFSKDPSAAADTTSED